MSNSDSQINLFYSYSHSDEDHRIEMVKRLKVLEQQGLKQRSDHDIIPGNGLHVSIHSLMDEADIIVFLVSNDWLASVECINEWNYAKPLEKKGCRLFCVILDCCAWEYFDDMKNRLVILPNGKSVTSSVDLADAWMDVFKGVKKVMEQVMEQKRSSKEPKPQFIADLTNVSFVTDRSSDIKIDEIFVFPEINSLDDGFNSRPIANADALLQYSKVLISGVTLSGKTTLAVHIFQELLRKQRDVLYVDLATTGPKRPSIGVYQTLYRQQFQGDFGVWKERGDQTIILDNLTHHDRAIDHVIFCQENFTNILVTIEQEEHTAYFLNDERLSSYRSFEITPLSKVKQERLIRRWLEVSQDSTSMVPDGTVDEMEARVNSVIVNNAVFPRFPYYVLSVLQSHEAFMPSDLSMSSYGHCHYVIILAALIKAGVNKQDSDITTCLNFSSYFAYYLKCVDDESKDFDAFVSGYREKFIIDQRLISLMCDQKYGIIRGGEFKTPYIFYYFLGKYLSENYGQKEVEHLVLEMVDQTHFRKNAFAVMSLVHHSNDYKVIEEITLRTMCSLDNVPPATLMPVETEALKTLVKHIPEELVTKRSTQEERESERAAEDNTDKNHEEEENELVEENKNPINDLYKLLRNTEILSQILKNKYGSIGRDVIAEIVDEVVDAGLRIVRLVLLDEETIMTWAEAVAQEHPEYKSYLIAELLRKRMAYITIGLLSRIARGINKREIKDVVKEVLSSNPTPARNLVEYFTWLHMIPEIDVNQETQIINRLETIDDRVVGLLFSWKTRSYINTHRMKKPIAQKIVAKLDKLHLD